MFDYQYLIVSGSSFFILVLGICVKYKFSHCKFGSCCSIDNDINIDNNHNDHIILDLPGIESNYLIKFSFFSIF